MLTRYLRLFALAAFAVALPAAGHHVDDGSAPGASAGQSAAVEETLSGVVDQLVVIDQVNNETHRYPILRQADGSRVALRGDAIQSLTAGAQATVSGAKTGVSFTVARVVAQAPGAKSSPPPTARVEGRFMVAHADYFEAGTSRFIYQVIDASGNPTEIDLPFLPGPMASGMQVIVDGNVGSDGTIAADQISILTAPPVLAASVTTNYLVLPIKFPISGSGTALDPWVYNADPFTPATLNTSVFGTLPTKSAKEYYKEASYGQQLLSGITADNGSGGFLLATVASPATCDINVIANAAAAAARLRGYPIDASGNPTGVYTGILYVFNGVNGCGWAGLAYVGWPRAYSNNTSALWVIGHELGHNFGLLHAGSLTCSAPAAPIGCGASGSVAEYGDPFNTMGNSGNTGHFDAAQKDILGWIAPTTVKTHAGGTATYQLSPIETGGQSAYAVKIPTTNANRTYWIEYRQPVGTFDAFIVPPSYPNAGAQIRVEYPFEKSSGSDDTEILDMTPATLGNFHDAALLAGAPAFVDPSTNVSINVLSATPGATGVLTVQVTTSAGTPSTTTLTSSPNPSNSGAGVTFTATVTGLAPTGTVSFTDGGAAIAGCASATLSGIGNSRTATCFTSSLTAGTHSIVATYSGDAGNAPSLSAALSQVVKSATTTTLTSSANPSGLGVSVTFTASVTGLAPTGTVSFTNGGASIIGCSAVAFAAGSGNTRTAACSTSALTAGSHNIVAAYAGDSANSPSTSSTLSQAVKAASTTVVVSSLNPSTSGASVTFTATVVGTAPTGSVNFTDGGSSIAGCSAVAFAAGSGNTRTATCATASLSVATHSIVASYGGDAGNAPSASSALSQVVNSGGGGSTNVALAANGGVASASSVFGSGFPVASVNNGDRTGAGWGSGGGWNDATAGAYPDWVQINFSGSKTIDHVVVVTLQDNFASPVQPTASTPFTLYGITAFTVQTWNGAAWVTQGTITGNTLVMRTINFASPVSTDRIRVNITGALASYSRIVEIEAWTSVGGGPAATTTAVASSLTPSTLGASVTFTATISGGVSPTGTVAFTDNGSSISGCNAAIVSAAKATCAVSTLTVGSHSIVATYSGDAGNAGSVSPAFTQVVNATGAQINVALASNGGVASASSTYVGGGMSFPVASVNNGDRAGLGWGSGGGWNDATASVYPDWVQINFGGSKTIDHVIVYTLQDNFASPVDPPNTLTFTQYGVTDFQVQGWNGSAWVTLGSVAGNNLVKRTVNFAPTATDRIRVNITGALASYSRVVEIEAWGN